jgi:hypothetical protein
VIRFGTLMRADSDNLQRLARFIGLPFLGLSHQQLAWNIEQALSSPTCAQGGPARITRCAQVNQDKNDDAY